VAGEQLADDRFERVQHRVDHPDRVGEVLPALVHERVASGAGPLADFCGDLDLLAAIVQRAVVDSHRVGVLVLDDGAVHERSEVLERLVVQVAAGDPRRDRLGELGSDLVHVGEAVCDRDRQLPAGGQLGDTGADLLGQGQLPAQVLSLAGVEAEVGADGGDTVLVAEAGAGLPAVAKPALADRRG
jgi:hypothetical protein